MSMSGVRFAISANLNNLLVYQLKFNYHFEYRNIPYIVLYFKNISLQSIQILHEGNNHIYTILLVVKL